MTDQEALDMAIKVAEKIMGWSEPRTLFDPARDIEDAFEVVRRMRELGFDYQIQANESVDVVFYRLFEDAVWRRADTETEAITRAALARIQEET